MSRAILAHTAGLFALATLAGAITHAATHTDVSLAAEPLHVIAEPTPEPGYEIVPDALAQAGHGTDSWDAAAYIEALAPEGAQVSVEPAGLGHTCPRKDGEHAYIAGLAERFISDDGATRYVISLCGAFDYSAEAHVFTLAHEVAHIVIWESGVEIPAERGECIADLIGWQISGALPHNPAAAGYCTTEDFTPQDFETAREVLNQ